MAAKRAKKSKKKTEAKRAVRWTAKKTKATKRLAKRSTKAKAAKRAPAKRAKAPVRKAKKAAKAARKEVLGEGNYTASREFRNAETNFVKKNKARIPAMGKAAEKALEGPEGDDLRRAEEEAKSHAHMDGARD